jgi:integrase
VWRIDVLWTFGDTGEIRVPKTGERRTIVLPPRARALLNTLPPKRVVGRDGWPLLFTNKSGRGHLRPPSVAQIYWPHVRREARKQGIDIMTPYELRSAGSSYLYNILGVRKEAAKVQMGTRWATRRRGAVRALHPRAGRP